MKETTQWALTATMAIGACPPCPALAWQILTPVSDACHENITLAAFGEMRLGMTSTRLAEMRDLKAEILTQIAETGIPESTENRRFIAEIVRRFDLGGRSAEETWFLASLVAGVRYPDTRGIATFKAHESRFTHLTDKSQAAHSLRRLKDDGLEGNASAIAETRALILGHALESHGQWWSEGEDARKISSTWTFPFFGNNVRVRVHAPTYSLALSMHTIQDSFTHTLRDEEGSIASVANYIELISGKRKESRDGPGHSDRLDECKLRTDFDKGRFQKAIDATTDFALATQDAWKEREFHAAGIGKVLDGVYRQRPDCGIDNSYCNSPWLSYAKSDVTKPFRLKPECGVIGGGGQATPSGFALLLLALPALLAGAVAWFERGKSRA